MITSTDLSNYYRLHNKLEDIARDLAIQILEYAGVTTNFDRIKIKEITPAQIIVTDEDFGDFIFIPQNLTSRNLCRSYVEGYGNRIREIIQERLDYQEFIKWKHNEAISK